MGPSADHSHVTKTRLMRSLLGVKMFMQIIRARVSLSSHVRFFSSPSASWASCHNTPPVFLTLPQHPTGLHHPATTHHRSSSPCHITPPVFIALPHHTTGLHHPGAKSLSYVQGLFNTTYPGAESLSYAQGLFDTTYPGAESLSRSCQRWLAPKPHCGQTSAFFAQRKFFFRGPCRQDAKITHS